MPKVPEINSIQFENYHLKGAVRAVQVTPQLVHSVPSVNSNPCPHGESLKFMSQKRGQYVFANLKSWVVDNPDGDPIVLDNAQFTALFEKGAEHKHVPSGDTALDDFRDDGDDKVVEIPRTGRKRRVDNDE